MDHDQQFLYNDKQEKFAILYDTDNGCYYAPTAQPSETIQGTPCEVEVHAYYIYARKPSIEETEQITSTWKDVFLQKTTHNRKKKLIEETFTTEQMFIATDGSLLETTGTYAWLCSTMDEMILASGSGHVRGASISMTSHRCEMYAMLAAFVFLDSLNLPKEEFEAIIIYSDSLPVVNWLLDKPEESYRHADDDLGRCIKNITQQLNIRWTAMHVKSHQKLTPVSPLSVRLNYTADQMASHQQKTTTEAQCRMPNNWEPVGAALVDDGTLSTHTANRIRQSTEMPKLKRYQERKFGWTNTTQQNIHMEVLKRVRSQLSTTIAWFSTRMQCRVLPTNSFLFRQNRRESPKCQGCGHEWEDNKHFLTCLKRRQQKHQFNEMLRQFFAESNTPPIIGQLVLSALHNTVWDHSVPPPTDPAISGLATDQSTIG